MVNGELIVITLILLILVILIIRYFELMPRLILWFISREISGESHVLMTPDHIGVVTELVEITSNQKPFFAWFLSGKTDFSNEGGILMVPDWTHREDQEYSLKTAGLLCQAGYNVLLPIYHWVHNNQEWVFNKRSVCPNKGQILIRKAYEYLCTRPEINKRNIGIWSNGTGTILACQLVHDLPIKAIVLEDGPVSLGNILTARLHGREYLLPKVVLHLLLFPFLWRSRWQGKNAVKNLRVCPSFLIANVLEDSQKKLWNTYSKLHKPRQLWFEYTLHSKALRDTWLQEYWLQLKSFFDLWLHNDPRQDQLELHYDFSVKRRRNGFHSVEIRLSVIPPQLKRIPLQIILSDGYRFSERRIWFGPGASTMITWPLKYRPNSISVFKFLNVESNESTIHWMKRGAEKALYTTIEKMVSYSPEKLAELMDRYFIQKSVLLNEQLLKEEAVETLKKDIKSKHWKNYLLRDPEIRLILGEDVEEAATTTDSLFLSS